MSQRPRLRSVCLFVMVVVCAALPAQADAPEGQYIAGMEMVTDTKTGLIWQQMQASATYDWSNAKNYCNNLNLNGFVWRLPTVKELLTLVDLGKENPSIDTSANGFPGTFPGLFWSATPVASAPSYAWVIGFGFGYTDFDVMANMNRVRCVR